MYLYTTGDFNNRYLEAEKRGLSMPPYQKTTINIKSKYSCGKKQEVFPTKTRRV